MIKVRNQKQLELMRKSGWISAQALKKVLSHIKVGISALELDKIAEKETERLGGDLAFTTVKDYKWATCITFNEQVVHGIPTDRKVVEGDIISVDLGAKYKGWCTDTAWSVLVKGEEKKSNDLGQKEKFLRAGKQALFAGMKQAVAGKRIGDISAAIQQIIEKKNGYSVVRSLVGHGVGEEVHEEPEVPGYGKAGTGIVLKEGMTLAIEVIYTKGSPDVVVEADKWTISSVDGSLAGLFEMDVIIRKGQPEVITDWRIV